MDAPTGTWPLSAAATAVLKHPRTKPKDVLKLALKELVLRRVWVIDRTHDKGRFRTTTTLSLREGDRTAPPLAPLPRADAALREAFDDVDPELHDVVRRMVLRDPDLARRLRDDAWEELHRRGLIELHRSKVLGRIVAERTADGDAWVHEIPAREASLRSAFGRPGAEVATEIATLGGLVLVMDPYVRAEIDDAVRRSRGVDAAAVSGGFVAGDDDRDDDFAGLDDVASIDLSGLDALDVDGSFDTAVDAGGGGGDGGGGGGDGGSSS